MVGLCMVWMRVGVDGYVDRGWCINDVHVCVWVGAECMYVCVCVYEWIVCEWVCMFLCIVDGACVCVWMGECCMHGFVHACVWVM